MKGIPSHYVKDADGNWSHPSRVGGPLPNQPQRDALPALDQKPNARRVRKSSVAVRVALIRVGQNLLDDDNLAAAYKGTRDAIAKSLGIDDGDPRIRWEYGQTQTRGRRGTIVRIEHV